MTRPAAAPAALRVASAGAAFLAAWLFLAAAPALADGGPHVKSVNAGAGAGSTLTADSCAGCHRAHTAQGPLLLAAPDEEALCLTCHGASGTGASTDVESGVQFAVASRTGSTGTVLGALRGGGFVEARIATGSPSRVLQAGSALNTWAKVGVGTTAPVTSSHLNLARNGLAAPMVVWGNDGQNTGAGPTASMTCASCHNPHGNGNYRILNPIPAPDATSSGTFVPVAAGVTVATRPCRPRATHATTP